ncbi:phosphoribosylformylglycinamidine synthase PurS subunit [Catalinimonas alkaloidigena]|uniref:phosphoribosylformylglycinamidine synthase subunit PurS n=1 Tax=Catalinimonas alkaloidigena TaxID=1075417 RepID=UPI0024062A5D|nr:phosphoribosylformylglycinamidine synthase subunit PurS [Catalinimonas alkaloidigena]MDF9797707.1 phosphoribosylformylglycinamidine synthase PurS subunit [Catalinimonas alkaloidigena]
MNFIAKVNIMPKKEILDPQGKAVRLGLGNLGLSQIHDVRIGKHITMEVDAENEKEASEKVELACQKLLANLIMENYEFELEKA